MIVVIAGGVGAGDGAGDGAGTGNGLPEGSNFGIPKPVPIFCWLRWAQTAPILTINRSLPKLILLPRVVEVESSLDEPEGAGCEVELSPELLELEESFAPDFLAPDF